MVTIVVGNELRKVNSVQLHVLAWEVSCDLHLMVDSSAKMTVMYGQGYLTRVEDMNNKLILSSWHNGETRLPLYI